MTNPIARYSMSLDWSNCYEPGDSPAVEGTESPDGQWVKYDDIKHLLHPEPSGKSVTVTFPDPPYEILGDSGKIYCPLCDGDGMVDPPSENRDGVG